LSSEVEGSKLANVRKILFTLAEKVTNNMSTLIELIIADRSKAKKTFA